MDYSMKQVEVREFVRKNRKTGVVEVVTVSNRNNLSVEEHLRLLNLNDPENEYSLPDAKKAPTEAGADSDDTITVSIKRS